MDTNKVYLVIRVGTIPELNVNPTIELDALIKKNGFCYFGKIGKNPSIPKLKAHLKDKIVYLVTAHKINGVFKGASYKLLDVVVDRMPPKGQYPLYYNEIGPIKTWFKISDHKDSVNLNNLILKSSGNNLIDSITRSSGSLFTCIAKN